MADTTLQDLMYGVGINDPATWTSQVKMKNHPYPWQFDTMKEAIATITQHDRFGDFSDAGTGKTFPMQFVSVVFASYGNKVVCVMPPILCEQFYETFTEFFIGIEKHLTIHILNQSPKKRDKLMKEWDTGGWPDILLMSYQMFKVYADRRRVFEKKKKVEGTPRPITVRTPNPYPDLLRQKGYSLLIADEAHALKDPGSQTHKRFWEYLEDTKGQYGLYLATGSPSGNTPEDAYGLIRLKTPEAYASKRMFDSDHVILDRNSKFRQVLGFKNFDLLNKNLYKNARRVSNEVFRTVKEPQVIEVRVALEPAHKSLYDQVVQQRLLELPDGETLNAINDNKMRQIAKQLISSPQQYTDKKIHNSLLDTMDQTLEGIDTSKSKVIIFAYYKLTVETLAKHYAALNPAVINGSSDTSKGREKFLRDDSCKLAIINWQSGGVGLNLQESCHYLLFAETPTVPKDCWQAIARVDRNGQKNQVIAYFFRVIKTIAGKHIKTLIKKDAVNNQVVRDKRALLGELMGENNSV